MTVSTTQIRVSYTGDGASVAFTVPWLFYANTDLTVLLGGVPQSSGFTVTGAGGGSGTVTFAVSPALGVIVQIILTVPLTQLVNLVDGTAFPSATLNQVNDRAIQAALRLNDIVSRAIRAPDSDVAPGMLLPTAALRASQYLATDANGNIITTPVALPGTSNTPQSLGPIINPQTPAETAAFTALGFGSVVNAILAPGIPDRYTTNTTPGTTNMLNAIVIALTQAAQSGGAPVQFLPAQYFVGTINNAGALLGTITGLANTTIYGNGAQITCNTTVASGLGAPVIFRCVNWENVTIDNLWANDTGFDITQTWKGAQLFDFTMSDATDRKGIRVRNCRFKNLVTPVMFTNSGGGTGRYRGITIEAEYDNCYNGPSFQEQGDEARIRVATFNCLRCYFPYGVSGHNVDIDVWHDSASAGANACLDIKRYNNDTKDIRVRANFHGFTSQYGSLVNLETQMGAGTAAITAFGAITAGAGGVDGTYYGVPLTGGAGPILLQATANITVRSGAVVRVDPATRGRGYANTDNLSAAAGNIGGVAGFSVAVAQVGAVIEGIDIDLHTEDAAQAVGVALPAPVQLRSFTSGGVLNPTTSDLWDRIAVRMNAGQGVLQPITIASVMTGVGPGRLSIDTSSFDVSPNVSSAAAQDFPGFVVRTAANVEMYGLQGNLTAAPLAIDLSFYHGRFFAIELDVEAESDYSNTGGNQTTQKWLVTGAVTTALAATINPAATVIAGPVVAGATSAAPALGTSGSKLTVTFLNYNGANARARAWVKHLSRLR